MTKNIPKEEKIKQLLSVNDPKALELIYDLAGDGLYSYMLGLSGSVHVAEELLSDLFIRIVDKRDKLAMSSNLKAYLFRMAANLCRDWHRRQGKYLKEFQSYTVLFEPVTNARISEDDKLKLNKALSSLPLKQREVIIMKIFQNKTFREIAEAGNISENTVVSRYRYALQKLKSFMENDNE